MLPVDVASAVDRKSQNMNNENVALPKDDFADYVFKNVPSFNDLDHSEFRKTFEIIYKIIMDNSS
jgi:RNA-directed DNA polymerase